jgi:hypothetical protein
MKGKQAQDRPRKDEIIFWRLAGDEGGEMGAPHIEGIMESVVVDKLGRNIWRKEIYF